MPETTSIVIFGATGDLTRRKLVPALYNLFRKKRYTQAVRIVGFARRDWSDEKFRDLMKEGVREFSTETYDDSIWQEFAPLLSYAPGNLTVAEDYAALDKYLRKVEDGKSNRLYHLSVSPKLYESVAGLLGRQGMAREENGRRRVIVEKPFGRDMPSARSLNHALQAVFDEHQIFRIDHYLGKETAQNILFFRFGNTVFEPIWNRNYVDHVQITVAETVDVGHRAGFYDTTGVLRDMFQNHILQLLALVAMEPPASFDADAIRNEKVKVFSAVRPICPDDVARETVRGQYAGYTDAEGVGADSQTPTFAALRFWIDNWRWQGVPFYLRSGKALAAKTSSIIIEFRCPPHVMFPLPPGTSIRRNILALSIQPDEGIHLRFEAKVPDTVVEMRSVDMEFHYRHGFQEIGIPEAYERLLLDALQGDASLFTRSDGIELSWKLMDPIMQGWEGPKAPPLAVYERGSWGPDEANDLIAHHNRTWLGKKGDSPLFSPVGSQKG
jgi:glucose-6-phosphate 1-dehydrogenase